MAEIKPEKQAGLKIIRGKDEREENRASLKEGIERIFIESFVFGDSIEKKTNDSAKGKLSPKASQLLAGIFIEPYLRDPENYAAVRDKDGRVVGYLIEEWGGAGFRLCQFLALAAVLPAFFCLSSRDRSILTKMALAIWKQRKLAALPNAIGYHINLSEEYRGKGIGSDLFREFMRRAREKGRRAIYAHVYRRTLDLEKGKKCFAEKQGMREFSRIKSEVFSQILPKEIIYLVCYAMEL
jgi:GNAT superfamily N-acetyltransferase